MPLGCFRGAQPLFPKFPPPLAREGDKGGGLLKKNLMTPKIRKPART